MEAGFIRRLVLRGSGTKTQQESAQKQGDCKQAMAGVQGSEARGSSHDVHVKLLRERPALYGHILFEKPVYFSSFRESSQKKRLCCKPAIVLNC